MKYTSDAARLCATHYSNARQDNGDAVSADEIRFANQDALETIDAQRQENIDTAYWNLRRKLEAQTPGGDELWLMAVSLSELAQDSTARITPTSPEIRFGWDNGLAFGYKTGADRAARAFYGFCFTGNCRRRIGYLGGYCNSFVWITRGGASQNQTA